jgi:hypothetical protein
MELKLPPSGWVRQFEGLDVLLVVRRQDDPDVVGEVLRKSESTGNGSRSVGFNGSLKNGAAGQI